MIPGETPGFVVLSLAALATLALPAPARAANETEALRQENRELRQRLDNVERDLAALRQWLTPAAAAAPATPTAAPAPVFTPAETEKLKALAGLKGKPARSSLDLNFYGYVKLDAAYDDSRTSLGNFDRWVETESVLRNDSHFNLTANQTRLGVDATGPTSETFLATGKVEFDLYGAGAGENKPEPMLRHAYVRMDWPKLKIALLAGQTWDIISPLNPNTVNYSVAWWQGNVGYRRPQIRLIKSVAVDEGVELKIDAGISRTITGRKAVFASANDPDTGADAGLPTFAGRVGLTFPGWNRQPTTFGLSGHYGTEEIHQGNLLGSEEYETWSVNGDLRLPLSATVLLQAEVFIGRNFDSHLGGIGQGINSTLKKEIDAVGGWAAFTFTPAPSWQYNLGASVDDPADGDLSGSTDPTKDARTKNTLVFGNVFYSLNAQVQLAFEFSWLRTTYKILTPGESWRQQFAIIYKF